MNKNYCEFEIIKIFHIFISDNLNTNKKFTENAKFLNPLLFFDSFLKESHEFLYLHAKRQYKFQSNPLQDAFLNKKTLLKNKNKISCPVAYREKFLKEPNPICSVAFPYLFVKIRFQNKFNFF